VQTVNSSWPPRWLTPVPEEAIARGRVMEPVVEFVEAYGRITKDSVAGKAGGPLILRPWQKTLLEHLFAWDETGLRQRVNLVGMPRKSGKSSVGAALGLYGLILGGKGSECYSVAAEKEQARIVFQDAKRTVEASPELSAITRLYRDAIELPSMNSVYRVLSAESITKEGLNPTTVIFDELHAQPDRELFDVFSLAQGSRGQLANMIAITTAGVRSDRTGKDSIAFSLYNYGKRIASGEEKDDTFFMAWWEAPEGADHRDPETWRMANPGFGDLNAESDFHSAIKRTPEAEFRIKRCNQWVSTVDTWLPAGAWDECAGEVTLTDDDEIVLGFDGSYNGDASVIVGAVVPKVEGDPVKVFLVKAWEKDLEHDPDDWRVDIGEVEDTVIDFCAKHRVREIACDPFRWQRSMEVLENKGLPVVSFPQSPQRMIKACARFYDAVADGKLVHDGDPLLSRHISNTAVKLTPAGPHIKKENPNSPRKIDAAVAAILAHDRASGKIEETVVPEFFG
jgi:phage terminase large subunit-like protein